MLTLKMKKYFYREEDESGASYVFDETTSYFYCEHVTVYGEVVDMAEMNAWSDDSYIDLKTVLPEGSFKARLIGFMIGGKTKWYLVSHAWLLGPDGKTIENLVP